MEGTTPYEKAQWFLDLMEETAEILIRDDIAYFVLSDYVHDDYETFIYAFTENAEPGVYLQANCPSDLFEQKQETMWNYIATATPN